MAVPKRRTSSARKNKRRAHQKLSSPNVSYNSKTGEYQMSHRVSRDGYYNGRKVIDK